MYNVLIHSIVAMIYRLTLTSLVQSPYQMPINALPTPTIVGVGRVLVGC